MSKPEGLVMVTDIGQRIPVDLKPIGEWMHADGTLVAHWQPVIEADLDKIMPSVVAFDGPPIGRGNAVSFMEDGPGWDSPEWGRRVMANSQHVFGWYEPGGNE